MTVFTELLDEYLEACRRLAEAQNFGGDYGVAFREDATAAKNEIAERLNAMFPGIEP